MRRAPTSLPGERRSRDGGLDAIVINASGCGTTVKDYGFMFRERSRLGGEGRARLGAGERCRRVPGRARARRAASGARAARRCLSFRLLDAARPEDRRASRARCCSAAGFTVRDIAEGASLLRLGRHLQHPAAGAGAALRDRKVANIARNRRRRSSPPAISAASCRSPAHRRSPCCTPSNCSTGRPGAEAGGAGSVNSTCHPRFRHRRA